MSRPLSSLQAVQEAHACLSRLQNEELPNSNVKVRLEEALQAVERLEMSLEEFMETTQDHGEVTQQPHRDGNSQDQEGKGRQVKSIVGGVLVLASIVGAVMLLAWFPRAWFEWVTSPWSKREVPMLMITMAVNAALGWGLNPPRTRGQEGEDRELENTGRTQNKIGEKFFETFCAYRLIVGSPFWYGCVRLITSEATSRFQMKENFGFRFMLLLSIYVSFKYRSRVIRTLTPVFAASYVWMLGGCYVGHVFAYPMKVLWRALDLMLFYAYGRLVIRESFWARAAVFISPFGWDMAKMLPKPICNGTYRDTYENLVLGEELTTRLRRPFEADHCVDYSQQELGIMLWSFYGVLHIVLVLLLYSTLYGIGVVSLAKRWWSKRAYALDEVEKVLANQNKVLEYARSNPFRAKLHTDPKNFLATKLQQSLSPKNNDEFRAQAVEQVSRKWEPSQSMHSKLGERAKTLTHMDRIQALRGSLRELHGNPDTYDLLFHKVKINLQRGIDAKGRCVFFQMVDQLLAQSLKSLKNGLCVTFQEESGVDGGGLTTEMFKLVAEELVQGHENDEMESLSLSSTTTTQDKLLSEARLLKALPDGTLFLKNNVNVQLVHDYALGRLIGLAILLETVFPLPLSSAMLKIMVDREIDSEDVRALDPTYFENRMLMLLEPGGVQLLETIMELPERKIPFVWIDSNGDFGEELCSNGKQTFLTEENKLQYIQLLSERYVCGDVREELQAFLSGFHEVIPVELLTKHEIDHIDLALTLQGNIEIDVVDWKQHTLDPVNIDSWEHDGQVITSEQLMDWFWESVREMDGEQRARLLQFSTGLSNAPVGGFANLKPREFNIVVDPDPSHWPTASTCVNTLRLPACSSKPDLQKRLLKILSHRETFGEQ